MVRIIRLLILLFVSHVSVYGQNSIIELLPYEAENAIILPKQDNKALILKNLRNLADNSPLKFAIQHKVNINTRKSGTWESNRSNMEVWHQSFHSDGAYSLNFGFTDFYLPKGASLYIHDGKGNHIGPFTYLDNENHRQLWTPILKGDKAIVEIHVEADKTQDLSLQLEYVNHDYLGFGNSSSGSCNLDVICGTNDGFDRVEEYRDIISSVGAYHINGVETCSGALIGNTRRDDTPYFLTAEHCGITSTNAASVVVYWNFENSYCRQPLSLESGSNGDGQTNQFNTGSILRAEYDPSDMALIELDDPIQLNHSLFFAGWDVNDQTYQGGIGIHHPGVEEKRISFEDDPLTFNNSATHIFVNDWDLGTTEGGSSGSPLFNLEKRIIGKLTGGLAACGNDQFDRYGKMSVSWEGGFTPESSLKPWLDPENSGVTTLDGYQGDYGLSFENRNYEICAQNQDSLILSFATSNDFIDFVNIDVEAIWPISVDMVSTNLLPGAEGEIHLSDLSKLTSGIYTIHITSSDGNIQGTDEIILDVNDNTPQIVALSLPENKNDQTSTIPKLIWNETNGAREYQVQLSSSPDFTDLILDLTTREVDALVDELSAMQEYFWRVRGINFCGPSDWSETFSFSTILLTCVSYNSIDTPLVISEDDLGEVTSNIFVSQPIIVEEVNILNFEVTHSYISDLTVFLVNPENEEELALLSRPCNDEDRISMGFDDSAISNNFPCPPVDGNLYKPIESLRKLSGIAAEGGWGLKVSDGFTFDGGSINSWTIEICFTTVSEASIIPLNSDHLFCQEDPIELLFFYDLKANGPENYRLEDVVGNPIAFETESNDLLEGYGQLKLLITEPLAEGEYEYYLITDNYQPTKVNFGVEELETPALLVSITNETLPFIGTIAWNGTTDANHIIQISTDPNFENVEWERSLVGANSIAGPSLADDLYYLRILAISDCGQKTSELYNFIIDESVSIEDFNLDQLEIFPNPVNELLTISGNKEKKKLKASIKSISGLKLLDEKYTTDYTLNLDVTNFAPGLYILELQIGQRILTQKVFVY